MSRRLWPPKGASRCLREHSPPRPRLGVLAPRWDGVGPIDDLIVILRAAHGRGSIRSREIAAGSSGGSAQDARESIGLIGSVGTAPRHQTAAPRHEDPARFFGRVPHRYPHPGGGQEIRAAMSCWCSSNWLNPGKTDRGDPRIRCGRPARIRSRVFSASRPVVSNRPSRDTPRRRPALPTRCRPSCMDLGGRPCRSGWLLLRGPSRWSTANSRLASDSQRLRAGCRPGSSTTARRGLADLGLQRVRSS